MEIRTLRAGEQEPLLDLLDLWDLGPGAAPGRAFFGDFMAADPTFEPRNVFVAVDDGLQACVQLFPRALQIADVPVPTGGIGTVFARPAARGRGVAARLLQAALADMRSRGMILSLLFAEPMARTLYERNGYEAWGLRRALLRPPATAPGPPTCAVRDFDAARDLSHARALRATYARGRDGVAERDPALWDMVLRFPGASADCFRVAHDGRRLCAYARTIPLGGHLMVCDLARGPGDAAALADLLLHGLGAREPDPLAAAACKASEAFRAFAVLPDCADTALWEELTRRGAAPQPVEDPTVMLQCLDARGLAAAVGPAAGPLADPGAGNALLRRLLPADRFVFWPADRF